MASIFDNKVTIAINFLAQTLYSITQFLKIVFLHDNYPLYGYFTPSTETANP